MLKENLTFNDLPEVVGKLCERIVIQTKILSQLDFLLY